MSASRSSKIRGSNYLAGTLAALLLAVCTVQADNKPKAAAPAKAAPAKPAAAAPKPGGGAAAAPHGPTTGGPAASHGPTTTTGAHGSGITTAGHGATTTTTAGHGATTTGAAGAKPAAAPGGAAARPAAAAPGGAGARATATPAGGRPAASPATRSMPHTASGAPPKGSTMRSTPKGDQVRMRAGGKPGDVHVAGRNMDIHHGLGGGRRSSVERADHSRIVAERGGRGYVQHPYMYHGHEYGHRTYWEHGRAYDRFYARYPYHGVYVEMYSPAFYYPPAFYGWAYNPWAVPIAYPVAAWGWGGNPWYGFYGAYFAPYPVYPSASLWLTDYLISTTLATAYQARVDAAAQAQAQLAADAAPLTPQVKDLISAEVQRQLAIENAESAQQAAGPNPAVSGVQRMLSDNQSHVFVAGKEVDVVDATGTECAISEGDVLQLTPTPLPDDATAATLVVMTTKGGVECKKGAAVTVEVADLQDMQNHMRESISQGMGDLKSKQGKGGLPALPASASGMPMMAQFAMDAPPPDATASQQITAQAQDADKAEQEVLAQAGSGDVAGGTPAVAAPPAPPVEIALGQTVDQVTGALGQPKNVVDLGAKKIYVFKDMKVTFKDGKVSDVQ
jgi:hypothetical protein